MREGVILMFIFQVEERDSFRQRACRDAWMKVLPKTISVVPLCCEYHLKLVRNSPVIVICMLILMMQ